MVVSCLGFFLLESQCPLSQERRDEKGLCCGAGVSYRYLSVVFVCYNKTVLSLIGSSIWQLLTGGTRRCAEGFNKKIIGLTLQSTIHWECGEYTEVGGTRVNIGIMYLCIFSVGNTEAS